MTPTTPIWIVDDVQRVVCSENHTETNGNFVIEEPPSHIGQTYSPDFVYLSEEDADSEVADRHMRLNKAFRTRDLLACLSINKEPERKSRGACKRDLTTLARGDKDDYHNWIETLKRSWEEVNGEAPDIAKLAKTLRNAQLIKEALSNPLAPDFTEIMVRENALQRSKDDPSSDPEP